jgi:hypothetical protein
MQRTGELDAPAGQLWNPHSTKLPVYEYCFRYNWFTPGALLSICRHDGGHAQCHRAYVSAEADLLTTLITFWSPCCSLYTGRAIERAFAMPRPSRWLLPAAALLLLYTSSVAYGQALAGEQLSHLPEVLYIQ